MFDVAVIYLQIRNGNTAEIMENSEKHSGEILLRADEQLARLEIRVILSFLSQLLLELSTSGVQYERGGFRETSHGLVL